MKTATEKTAIEKPQTLSAAEKMEKARSRLAELQESSRILSAGIDAKQQEHADRLVLNVSGDRPYSDAERTDAMSAIRESKNTLTRLNEDIDAIEAYLPRLARDASVERARGLAGECASLAESAKADLSAAVEQFNRFLGLWSKAMSARDQYDEKSRLMDKIAQSSGAEVPLKTADMWSVNVEGLRKALGEAVLPNSTCAGESMAAFVHTQA